MFIVIIASFIFPFTEGTHLFVKQSQNFYMFESCRRFVLACL